MTFRLHILTCCTVLSVFVREVDNQNAFSAVTASEGLATLYLRMSIREPHIEPDEKTDADTKSNICQSITSSSFFVNLEAYSADMDTIFTELNSRARREKTNIFLHRMMHDYEAKGIWRVMYTYASRLTPVEAGSRRVEQEFGFACATTNNENRIELYLVSDAYNINAALDFRTEGAIAARFVFRCASAGCALLAMAEQPAKAYAGVDYSVEQIYLRMRNYYDVAQTTAEDPVCRLPMADKVRVCAVVTSSRYFVGKLRFPSDRARVAGPCQLTRVTLQTDEAKREARGDSYEEWMLPCTVEPRIEADARYTYYVSRAYHSHHAIVYSRDRETATWYIENISANISVVVEKRIKIRVESVGRSPPNLVHQLRAVDEL